MMRNAFVQLGLVLLGVTSVHAVKLLQTASLRMRISPTDGAEKILVIQGNDSITLFGNNGLFYIPSLHPGNWHILVNAKRPYRDMNVQAADIRPGIEKDLGELRLEK